MQESALRWLLEVHSRRGHPPVATQALRTGRWGAKDSEIGQTRENWYGSLREAQIQEPGGEGGVEHDAVQDARRVLPAYFFQSPHECEDSQGHWVCRQVRSYGSCTGIVESSTQCHGGNFGGLDHQHQGRRLGIAADPV